MSVGGVVGTGGGSDLEMQWASLLLSLAAHRPLLADGGAVDADRAATPVPVTILTGFLGSGKSTLLARLLADPGPVDNGPVRAVVNDIGSLAFDPTLVGSVSADDGSVELTNGCGCCVAGAADELGQALDRAAPGARLVVLEASGVADPQAVAQVVAARPGLHVERTVAVVDTRAVERLLALPGPAAVLLRQLEAATVIVLSHADGLPAEQRAAAVDRVAALAPGRPVAVSTLAAPAHRTLVPGTPAGIALAGLGGGPPAGGLGSELVVVTVEQRGAVDDQRLERVLADRPAGLLRGKGRLRVDAGHVLVQFTPSGWSITPAEPGPGALTLVAVDDASLAAVADLLTGR
ncbi:MAG: GTP-binding protein [Acidimicrobiales bacterium]